MHERIVAIETAGPDGRARRLVFSESEPRVTAAAVVRVLGIAVDDHVEILELAASLDEHEVACARERALRVLGYRDRSSRELEQRLTNDGYPAGVARQIVLRFVELDLLNDERFAHQWARTRSAAGFGAARIARGLKDKGVAPALVEAALADIVGTDSEVERARALLRDRVPENRDQREKLVRKLVRRGFSLAVALKAVPEVGDTIDTDA